MLCREQTVAAVAPSVYLCTYKSVQDISRVEGDFAMPTIEVCRAFGYTLASPASHKRLTCN